MNAQTKLSAKGQVVIPKDVRDRLHWAEGTQLKVVETGGGVMLMPLKSWLHPKNPFPLTTTSDLRAGQKWEGPPKSIEEISGLSKATLRRIFEAQDSDEGI